MLFSGILKASKYDSALRVVADDDSTLRWALGEAKVKFELWSSLDQIQRGDILDITHDLSYQILTNDFVTFQLLKQAGVKYFS